MPLFFHSRYKCQLIISFKTSSFWKIGRCVNQDKVLVVGVPFQVNWAIFHWTMMMKGCNVYIYIYIYIQYNVIHFPTTCGERHLKLWHESWKWSWVPLQTVTQASRCLPYEHVSAHVTWPLLNPWSLLVFHYKIYSDRCTCCSKWLAIIPANHQERAPFPSQKKKIQEETPAHWQSHTVDGINPTPPGMCRTLSIMG